MELESIKIFVKVIQVGSFTRAAEQLRLPKSTVSRAVRRLETETGTQLLLRTTRSLRLTPAGRAFYEASAAPVRALEDARRSIQGGDRVIAGPVKLTAPEDLGSHAVSPALGRLLRDHPDLSLDVNYTDEVVDLVRDGYDLAVRLGPLPASGFRALRLGEVFLIPVAAPTYLARAPKIREPRDLRVHHGIAYTPETTHPRWTLRSGRSTVHVGIRVRAGANQMSSVMAMAEAGGGVAFAPSYLCRKAIAAGRLTPVLPGWLSPGFAVSLVSPRSAGMPARVRVVADRLAAAIREGLIG